MTAKSRPAIVLKIDGAPKTKENKQGFASGRYYNKKHADVVDWEVEVNHEAIAAMKDLGFPGPYKGRCEITAAMTYESWKRCDITNYWKSLNDALNGAVWVDDSQVDCASIVRLIDRDDPNVYVMVWFYDFCYEEAFGTKKKSKAGNPIMKYPATYGIFDLAGYEYKPNIKYITTPEEVPAARWGAYERLVPREEREKAKKGTKKQSQTKPNRKRTVPSERAKAEAAAESKRRRTSSTGTKGSNGRRKSS